MKIISTRFKDLKIIRLNNLNDLRGSFIKLFEKKNFFSHFKCIESYMSRSKKGSVRGLHAQKGKYSQEKIIFCIQGKVMDISIDLRKNSKTFGKIYKKILNSKKIDGLFIPKGFVHGLIALENNTTVINFCSNKYNPKKEFGINIKSIGLTLPKIKLFISNKDKNLPDLKKVIQKI